MKQSIKKIFQNLNTYFLFVLFVALVGMLLVLELSLSFDKVDNLNNQKKIIFTLTKLDKSDLELALIQFNGKSTQLHQEIDKLRMMYKYAVVDKYIIGNKKEYFEDLDRLSKLTDEFNQSAKEYYIDTDNKKLEMKTKIQLDSALQVINQHIDTMLLKNIIYNEEKFKLTKNAVIIIFVLILLATFWYRKMINSIYKDIAFLQRADKNRKTYDIFSQEVDAISLRMNRKNIVNDNPDMLDQVTDINNYKGMLNSYSQKKNLKDSNFTSVTVLEIDNFSKSNRAFPQDVIQSILKKIAYSISLHEQPVDVIGRTDYNQFTIILSRASKEQSFKDVELIRESINELKFNIPGQGGTKITVSGGFTLKPNNTPIDEAMKQSKEILKYAQSTGVNRILQTRDLAK